MIITAGEAGEKQEDGHSLCQVQRQTNKPNTSDKYSDRFMHRIEKERVRPLEKEYGV